MKIDTDNKTNMATDKRIDKTVVTMDKDNHDNIGLRSEKVRELLGEIPPSLVRWGTAIIAIVFIGLVTAVCLLPYPYSNGESILRHFIG
ncbi:MAG: hypothetical protein K1W14_03600 [Muribaculaceae bacterium]|jgi:hypothetical protein